MIKINFRNNLILVDTENLLNNWKSRVFLKNILGYSRDAISNNYVYEQGDDITKILSETVEFLKENKIEYDLDRQASSLLNALESENKAYEKITNLFIDEIPHQIDVLPPNMVRTLKPYQQECVNHMLTIRHGANFSVPGSGKTTMVYAVYDVLRSQGIVEKILVIGPTSAFLPWEEEYEACFDEKISSARLSGDTRPAKYIASDQYELFLVHYQTASRDLSELITLCKKHKFLVVVDESHYIKRLNDGVWSNAMLNLAPHAERRMILSGTPMPNDYSDLWTQFTFLWTGEQILGDKNAYKERLKQETEIEKIRAEVRPFFTRITKSDLNLPAINFHEIVCDLSPYQQKIYDAIAIKFLSDLQLQPLERIELRSWRKARLVRLIQAASNPTLLSQYSDEFRVPPLSGNNASIIQIIDGYPEYEVPAKFLHCLNLIESLVEAGEKVVVWTSFVFNIDMLVKLITNAGIENYRVHGAIPKDESEDEDFNREQQISSFKSSDKPCILIANPAACAESISLHRACKNAIYLDRTFNAGQYIQSLDRIHRIGSDSTVNYYLLIATGTIDETIDRRVEQKKQAMQYLLEENLPVGTLQNDVLDIYELGSSDQENGIDFDQVVSDLKKNYQDKQS
ncbi:MAG: DEAD/DEAH box helicase [Phototrophicaceae bacterium]